MEGVTNPCTATMDGIPGQLFLTLISSLMAAQCTLKTPHMDDHAQSLNNFDEFDFIVVGAGSAGSVVANRLSEIDNWRVLVLEAGGDPSVMTQIPSLLFSIQKTPEDWQQITQPQEYSCQSFRGQSCRWPSGKMLGGSSSMNGMLYVRGNKQDYDNWEAKGNTGWGYKDALKYYKKSEDNTEFNNKKYHSQKGYLTVTNFSLKHPIKTVISKAAEKLGYPALQDIHNGTVLGFGDSQGTVKDGTRFSTYEAFLYSIKERPNLYIAKNAYVTKINFDATKTAKSVDVQIGGKILTISAKNEIIISAGALKTPQILMLSGLGPKDHLKDMEIPLVQDLAVGENLQDHMMHLGLYVKFNEMFNKAVYSSKTKADVLYDYFMHKKGAFSTIGITNFVGFINTLSNSKYPDIQYHHIMYMKKDEYLLKEVTRVTSLIDEIKNELTAENQESLLLQICPTILNPKSRGTIKLKNKDPFQKAIIYSNYLKEDEDLETLLRSIKFVQELLKTDTFSKINPQILDLKIPNCAKHTFQSDDYFRCSLRNLATTVYHYCGTAKMGPDSDPTAVVNPRLMVRGVKSLRVADASIMPYLVSGNTNAPTIMIGEKAADMIKEDWEAIMKNKRVEL